MNKLELKFRFKAIKELLEITNTTLEDVPKLAADFTKYGIIGYVGQKHAGGKLTLEQVEDLIDEDSELLKHIVKEFSEQFVRYTNPNGESQSHLNA